ncbi:fimbrial protein [Providencia huaxiensis]|uniref:Fimbrial protein n=3 Tax=Providencia TaxID=586 RepID=A0A345LYJ9_9GAMM|nr:MULTISPECIES: fimbrial protein [Providencia]AXH63189.1 fimbrial protein [Providencia huaxiensis]MBQ0269341.1 fimbrial protein [Providencia huaxiensis]MBQ0533639.1 fimbrial protein [Providencia huaxiensis]MBQ0589134.1 fimbrial protein [Providencia huaxiensis]MBZ3680971.1 fimbrial protein [Providencia rettgeri]
MKKNLLASLIAATSIVAVNNALAADGTIDFTGEIIDQACELAAGSDALKVNLGQVSKKALPNAGSTAAATKFTIKLINCPATVTTASVKFDADSYIGDDEVIKLKEETGVATGVGIQITDDTNKIVPLFTASKAYPLQQNVENNLDFRARYIAKSDTVTPGPANATATFTINYN